MVKLATLKSDRSDAVRCGERGAFSMPLTLVHGADIEVECRFEASGPVDAPVVIVGGGISAGRHVVSNFADDSPGWWEGQQLALANARVLAIDWIGADGSLDCPIDPLDQATMLARLLDELGIKRAAFIGASYGAMVGQQLAAHFPDRCAALLSISAGASAHPFSSACRSLQRKAIAIAEAGGDPAAGVALARALAMLTYRTADEYRVRFDAAPTVTGDVVRVSAEDYLDAQGLRYAQRTGGAAYRRLSESIDLHRVDPAALRLPATFVAVESDWLVPIEDISALARAVPNARFVLMPSLYGHDGFLKEEAQVATIISEFLASLEPAR
ncbi:homoserine O-succinyltransferase MetX [Sphingomonas sp. RB1R13]|uniref:homoserine O-succinyltransferase MetX n=1 Tax=Sphingomonas sp. RB1R13 TaxID=3096159 RepID=UPI002FCC43E8